MFEGDERMLILKLNWGEEVMEERDGWIECKETLRGIRHEEKAGDEWREVADFGGRRGK